MSAPSANDKLLALLGAAVRHGTLVKLTLSNHRGADPTLKNLFVRPVVLRDLPHLSFLFRHATRDITKNFSHEDGLRQISALLGGDFRSAHLFTTEQSAQLEFRDGREPRLKLGRPKLTAPPDAAHDRAKTRLIDAAKSPWLHALGVTTADGQVAKGMEAKFRQINKFAEVLEHLLAKLPAGPKSALHLVDMGCGKGYLTFAAHELLQRGGWPDAQVRGVEAKPELAELCQRVAQENGFAQLHFEAGTIESTRLERVDVLVALHACDTATDDAIAKGIEAGAALILVAPCCHKELRPQLVAPPALASTLRHGILRERQAEFVTDALRAALLEWAGYETKVFEFISPEHTGKNLMIAAVKHGAPSPRPLPLGGGEGARRAGEGAAANVRALAALYGIHSQRLAQRLQLPLLAPPHAC